MDEFVKRYPDYKYYVDKWQISFSFIPIDKSMFFKTNIKQTSILLGTIGFVAMLIACLNYVLLTISSLSQRSKTIAMLRCNGAKRNDIFNMLIFETLLILFVAI